MNSNTFPSKLNFFGVFSLIVMLSVFSSLAYGAATVSPASSIFIAGSSNNDVTINITGATVGTAIVITPPTGWNGTGVTGATGGAGTGAITVNPAAASVTVVYSATAGTTVGLVDFTVTEGGVALAPMSVDVVSDGSGVLSFKVDSTDAAEDQTAGQTAQTIDMYYTAVGSTAGVLSGGSLVLDIPSAFAAPTATNLKVTKGDGTAADIGTVTYVGNKVTVPLTTLNGGDQLKLSYTNVTIPAAATYNFAISTASSSPAFGVPFKVGDLVLTVQGAGVGTGTVVASGGPYSAGSTGNTITFTYTAAGTMTGGRVEIIPPAGWTDPQGEPGQPGYTIVRGPDGAQYATSDVIFGASATEGFVGNGVGIKVGTLELNQVLTVIYGYTGTASGATAASSTGFSRFEVNATPNASLDTTDDATVNADAGTKFATAKQPKVSVQAGDGSGTIAITTNPAAVTASAKTTITVAYTVAGLISDGAFYLKFPANWPVPVVSTDPAVDGKVEISAVGATLGTESLVGRELTIPITFIQAAKTITVEYIGTAPSTASTDATQLIVKSRGTSTGSLAIITNTAPDPDLNYWPIAVGKAAHGSGSVGVDVTTVTAGSIGNIFNITYKAVGQLDGGKIKISRPAGWATDIEANISANSTNVALDADASTADHAVYNITTLGKDGQIVFTYSGVEVPKDFSENNVIGFAVSNDALADAAAVTTDLCTDLLRPNNAAAGIKVDYAADGTGTVAIYESGTTTVVTTQSSLESDNLDIVYTPFAAMLNGKIVLQIPTGWTAPTTANIAVTATGVGADEWSVDGTAMTVTVTDIDLDETSTVKIGFTGAKAPSVGGASAFSLTSQSHISADGTSPTGRALAAVGSVSVNVADVVKGRGKAGITSPVVQSAGTDTADVTTDDAYKREFLKGEQNQKIVFSFEAVGPMAGADVQFEIDSDYVTDLGSAPQTTSSSGAAYASVTSAPAGSYSGLSVPNTEVKYLRLSGVTLTAGQSIEVTLNNLSFSAVATYTFPVYMRYGTSDTFSNGSTLSSDGNTLDEYLTGFDLDSNNATGVIGGKENLPLTLKVLSVEGKGTLAVTPGPIFRTETANNYQLQFTAAATTGAIRIDLDGDFSPPVLSTEAAPKSTVDAGFVRIESGTGTLSVTGQTIMVKELSLIAGQTITVGYYQATYDGNTNGVGAVVFNGRSTSDTTGGGLTSGGAAMDAADVPTVYFISSDGVGMVTRTASDTTAGTSGSDAHNLQRQPVINGTAGAGTKAGSVATTDFYYSLDDNQYIKSGELELVIPSDWTAPTKGTNAERNIDVALNDVPLVEADWGSKITVSGQSIIVSIDVMTSIGAADDVLKVSYKGTSPNNIGEASVTVLQRSGNLTARTDIAKNRKLDTDGTTPISGSAVSLKTIYGDAKKGTVTSSSHVASVAAGSGPYVFSFTYATPVEIDPDTELKLRIPGGAGNTDWTAAVDTADAAGQITTSTLPVDDAVAGTEAGSLAVAGNVATVVTGTLKAGGTLTINYNKATAPSVSSTEYATTGRVFALTIDGTDFTDKDAGTAATGTVLADSTDVTSSLAIGNTDTKVATGVFVTTLAAPTVGTGSVALVVTDTSGGATAGNNTATYGATAGDIVREQVHAGDTGVIVTLTYTSSGKMDGQFIRLVVPDGWTAPQGNPSAKGYTVANNIGTVVGYPSYSGQTVSFPIVALAYNNNVVITYGSGGGTKGADVPNTSVSGDSAPIFKIETSADGTAWSTVTTSASTNGQTDKPNGDEWTVTSSGVPVDIVSARAGTGTAVISPAEVNAGDKVNYTVTYTAASTMNGGTVSLIKNTTFTMTDANWIADAADTAKVLVATSGTLKPTADATATTPATVPFARTASDTVTAYIDTLPAGGTVTFTINELTAPSTTNAGLDFTVKTTGGVNSAGLTNIAALPKVVVIGAKNGSGTAALTTGPTITKVGTVFTTNIVVRYTAVAAMAKGAQITLEIPAGWSAPILTGDGDNLDITGISTTGADNAEAVSGQTITGTIGGGGIVANDTVTFTYKTPTAQATAGTAVFNVRSSVTGVPVAADLVTGSPSITVAQSGSGSGKLAVAPDTKEVNTAGTYTFTYTASEAITKGEVTVTIPDGWTAPAVDVAGTDADEANVSAGATVSGRVVTVPIAALAADNAITFTYTGTAQANAGTASFNPQSKVAETGTLTDIPAGLAPIVTLTNVAPGRKQALRFMTGALTTVSSATAGNELVFELVADGTMDGGSLQIDIPTTDTTNPWTAPQLNAGQAGYVLAQTPSGGSAGAVTVAEHVITVPIVSLAKDQVLRVRYGAASGSSGATAQGTIGYSSFKFETKGKADDAYAVAGYLAIEITNAASGTGSAAAGTASIAAGDPASLTFTYTAAGTIDGGAIKMALPTGSAWPAITAANTTATAGAGASVGTATVASDGSTIEVPVSSLGAGQTVAINYGGGSAITVPSQLGSYSFNFSSKGSSTGSLVSILTQPSVTVSSAADGSGTGAVSVTTGTITAGSTGNSFNVTYTAVGPVNGGAVLFSVPSTAWAAPDATNTTVASTGTVGTLSFPAVVDADGQAVEDAAGQAKVESVVLAAGQTVTFTYANVTAPGAANSYTFGVQSTGTAAGVLASVAGTLEVTVANAAAGSGSLAVSPSSVIGGSTKTITLTYTAIGDIANGFVKVSVPTGWTAPSGIIGAAGGVTASLASGSTGSISAASVTSNFGAAGSDIIVPVNSLGADNAINIVYSNATSPVDVGSHTFAAATRDFSGAYVSLAAGAAVTTTEGATDLKVSSDARTAFKGEASQAITVQLIDDAGVESAAAAAVSVGLTSSSATGTFASDAAFTTVVTSVTVAADQTTADFYYKDTASGSSTVTATATIKAVEKTASQVVTVTETASALAVADATGFVGAPIAVTISTLDAADAAATTVSGITVTLTATSGTFSETAGGAAAASVAIASGATSKVVYYQNAAIGTVTITAAATGLTSATTDIVVSDTVASVTASGSPVKAGGTATVTAVGKAGGTATFSVGTIVTAKEMTESTTEAGTYTGEFTAVAVTHADGAYDVTVTIDTGSKAATGAIVVDNVAPALTAASADLALIKNGQTLVVSATADTGSSVSVDASALDTTATAAVALAESATTAGSYSGSVAVSADNAADNGTYALSVTATDAAGNTSAAVSVSVELRNYASFDLAIPQGTSLIHLPLAVTSVNDVATTVTTVGQLYDAIGADNVNFLITYDNQAKAFRSYLGDRSKGQTADREITADLGIIALMKKATTLQLKGDALGTDGKSQISLGVGLNLVGVPLKDSRISKVSDLLALEGLSALNAIVSDNGVFKVVSQADDDGDIDITGGQSFVMTSTAAATAEVSGEAWDNVSTATATAPAMAIVGIQDRDRTPVLEVHGSVTADVGVRAEDFLVTVNNLTTGETLSSDTVDSGYTMTFVDVIGARAARIGDVLEITVSSTSAQVGVQAERHVVSTDDVGLSQIRVPDMLAYEVPTETALLPNYPNPFNPETWIPFRLAKDADVSLRIYNTAGSLVRTIELGHHHAAVYETKGKAAYWDGRNNFGEQVASGVYFYSLSTDDYSETRKMLILK